MAVNIRNIPNAWPFVGEGRRVRSMQQAPGEGQKCKDGEMGLRREGCPGPGTVRVPAGH